MKHAQTINLYMQKIPGWPQAVVSSSARLKSLIAGVESAYLLSLRIGRTTYPFFNHEDLINSDILLEAALPLKKCHTVLNSVPLQNMNQT